MHVQYVVAMTLGLPGMNHRNVNINHIHRATSEWCKVEKDHSVNVGAIKVIGLSAVLKMRSCSFGFGLKPE